MSTKVTIITVTYNSSNNIENLLRSILLNKDYVRDLIIVDNDSSDKEKIKRLCNKYIYKIKIKLINNKNVGFGTSCNLGVSLAYSKNILFLNPDTELQENSLKFLIEHKQSSHADIIGGKARNYGKKVHGSVVRLPNLFFGLFEFSNLGKVFNIKTAHDQFYYEDKNILFSKIDEQVDVVSGAYLLTTTKIFEELSGFDENIFMYLEDVDLGKRARDRGLKVVFCPHSIILHRGGASSNNKYKINHEAWFFSRKYYFRKHFGILTNLIIQPIFIVEEKLLKLFKSL